MNKTDLYFNTLKAIATECDCYLNTVEAVLYGKATKANNTEAIKAALIKSGLLVELRAA